jgi:large subunit ribosomal protein L15
MRLHDLKPRPGAKHRRKRLGQGESSGHGKTSGRGGKGQTARSGSSIRIGFEGGQMPLIRRIPKRGFNNKRFAIRYVPVNLEALNQFDDGATVDEAALRTAGLANGGKRIKILGDGELKKKLTVKVHSFSSSARAKIEKLGGVCEVPAPTAGQVAAAAKAAAKDKASAAGQEAAAANAVARKAAKADKSETGKAATADKVEAGKAAKADRTGKTDKAAAASQAPAAGNPPVP